ncbi:CRACD-like protein [Trichomycterus rosablanca]|uniref:CRACD-like protein n=1 Tax=Trichomycterus rosablanca TaxID=2290929 RepID=UPI002F351E31
MESSSGETDGHTEDLTVRKKSRFRVLKSRLFSRLKKKETEGRMKQSQSTGDVTAQEGRRSEDESEDDSLYPKGTLSSRALSHDSIFLADQVQSTEPTRVLSQENVHSRIKALQLKLQQQNMRLVRPPLLIPGKHVEDSGATSEDDGLPCSPPEMSFQEAPHRANLKFPRAKRHLSCLSLAGTGSEEEEQGGFSQPSSRPLSPASPLSPLALISSPADFASASEGVDFASPAQVPILDNSAARHRMSVKPRNQRASTKGKRPPNLRRPKSNSLNNLDQPLSETEETPQSVTTTQTMNDYSCYSQDATLAEVSLTSTIELQEQEKVRALDGGPLSPSKRRNEAIKPAELFQPESKIRSNTPALQPMPTLCFSMLCDETERASDLTKDQLGKEPLDDSQHISKTTVNVKELFQTTTVQVPHSLVNRTTLYDVTNEKTVEIVTPGSTDSKNIGTDVSKSAESSTRMNPVPPLRTKKPTPAPKNNNAPIKIPSSKPSNENEAASYIVMESSSRQDDKPERSGSFRFCSASAKYLSKTSGEQMGKQDEEIYDNIMLLKSISYNQNLPTPVKPVANTKTTDGCRNADSNPDKKISLQSNTMTQNASRTAGSNNPENKESRNSEEAEDRSGLFGVKLRSTSLSLRYRSDLASLKDKTKRHSLEAHPLQSGLFGEETSISDMEAISPQGMSALQSTDSQDDPTLNKVSERETCTRPSSRSETDCRSEPPWMGIARERTRVHQSFTKPPTQPALPPNFASSSTTLSSSTQPTIPKPTIQPRTLLLPTSKSQLKTSLTTELQPVNQPLPQHPPKPTPRLMLERWSMSNQRAEKSAASQSTNADELPDVKGESKSRARSTNQMESDQQQSQPDRTQPSWMELAKRKSLAWSDKSLD